MAWTIPLKPLILCTHNGKRKRGISRIYFLCPSVIVLYLTGRFHYKNNVKIRNGVQHRKDWVPKPLTTNLQEEKVRAVPFDQHTNNASFCPKNLRSHSKSMGDPHGSALLPSQRGAQGSHYPRHGEAWRQTCGRELPTCGQACWNRAHSPHVPKYCWFRQICCRSQFPDHLPFDCWDAQHFRLHLVDSIGAPPAVALVAAMDVKSSWPRSLCLECSSDPSNHPRVAATSRSEFRDQARRNTFLSPCLVIRTTPAFILNGVKSSV